MVKDTNDTGDQGDQIRAEETGDIRPRNTDKGRLSIQGQNDIEANDVPRDSKQDADVQVNVAHDSSQPNETSPTREIRYETKSPHEELERYVQLRKMARYRKQIGDPNSVGKGHGDFFNAVEHTLKASKASDALDETKDEKAMREWLQLKHGKTPYTERIRTETIPKIEEPTDPFKLEGGQEKSDDDTTVSDKSIDTKGESD